MFLEVFLLVAGLCLGIIGQASGPDWQLIILGGFFIAFALVSQKFRLR